MPAHVVDGQDVFDVYDHMGTAVARARAGDGPSFLECKTYRYYGHFLGDDPLRYRTKEEEAHYRGRDCLVRFEQAVRARSLLSDKELESIRAEVEQTIERAVEFAESSPLPEVSELTTEVYA
jgi:pyruvate dehydrogenase E1 component alpha subunit